ncbi:MAG TPA: BON domain-containing protein [Abditibacteriaceae bacterium]
MQNEKCKKSVGCVAFCILHFLFCIFFSGCDQKQQTQIEKQVEGVANSVQKTTATTVERTLQETVVASQSGGATLRVKTALTVSSRLEGAQIDVELQGQKIILRGNVQTARQKQIAHSIAQNTLDPKFKIINRLIVPSYSSKKSFRYEQPHRAGL